VNKDPRIFLAVFIVGAHLQVHPNVFDVGGRRRRPYFFNFNGRPGGTPPQVYRLPEPSGRTAREENAKYVRNLDI